MIWEGATVIAGGCAFYVAGVVKALMTTPMHACGPPLMMTGTIAEAIFEASRPRTMLDPPEPIQPDEENHDA